MRATLRHGCGAAEGVVVQRLRTEGDQLDQCSATSIRTHLRRFRRQHADIEIQVLEVDLHCFLVAAVHLRRCIERMSRRMPGFSGPLTTRLRSVDIDAPSLLRPRNVSEHIDQYNLDLVRRMTSSRWLGSGS